MSAGIAILILLLFLAPGLVLAYVLAAICSAHVFLDPALTQWDSGWTWFWLLFWFLVTA